jgi:hypothetical protein
VEGWAARVAAAGAEEGERAVCVAIKQTANRVAKHVILRGCCRR